MMKGSDNVKMTLNIGGELIILDVDFDEQIQVRDTERAIKKYIDHLRKSWPDKSDRNIMAMALYQFARWCDQLQDLQQQAIEAADTQTARIEAFLKDEGTPDPSL